MKMLTDPRKETNDGSSAELEDDDGDMGAPRG